MRYITYSSKTHAAGMLVVLALFSFAFYSFAWARFPLFPRIIFCALIVVAVGSCLLTLLSTKPVIVADENGLLCYRATMTPIPWGDVVAAIRVPRVEKIQRGRRTAYSMSFTESTRPIDLYVANIEKHSSQLGGLASKILKVHNNPDYQGYARLRINLLGTTGDSARLHESISFYLAQSHAARGSA